MRGNQRRVHTNLYVSGKRLGRPREPEAQHPDPQDLLQAPSPPAPSLAYRRPVGVYNPCDLFPAFVAILTTPVNAQRATGRLPIDDRRARLHFTLQTVDGFLDTHAPSQTKVMVDGLEFWEIVRQPLLAAPGLGCSSGVAGKSTTSRSDLAIPEEPPFYCLLLY